MYKNVASQKLAVYLYNALTGTPVTGDAANITAQISLDGGACAATNDTNPTEIDATDQPGLYLFDLTQAETNANLITVAAVSATSTAYKIDPVAIYAVINDVDDALTTVRDSLTTGLTNTLTHTEAGVAANLSAAPTIDVTRADTGASLTGYSKAMTAVSTGIYNDTFTPPATGIAYNISMAYTQTNGATRTVTGTVVSGTAAVTANAFITVAEFYQFYDANLIARLSDDSNAGTTDTTVIQIKLNSAAAFMHQYLRGHYYNIDASTFTTVDDDYLDQLNADIAMYLLYSRRGEVPAMIAERYQRADFELQQIQQGQRQLDGGRTKKAVTYAYPPNIDDDDQGIAEAFNIGQAGTNRKIGMP